MSKKVKFDKTKCIGCATCVVLCPAVFSLDEKENVAVVNHDAVETADPEQLKSAVLSCPSGALALEE